MNQKTTIYQTFDRFGRALIGSRDVDPVYPFVKSLVKKKDFEPEWFVFVYVAFYNLESAIQICEEMPTREDWDATKFRQLRTRIKKFGHERRGTCRNVDNQVIMLDAVVEAIDIIHKERMGEIHAPILDDNPSFRDFLMGLPFHGLWASYKIAELFEKSLGYSSLRIEDLGLTGRDPNSNDGPVGGLRHLYGREEMYDESFFPVWNRFGFNLAKAWGVDIGEVETCFCKFHKLVSGKYHIGHDIEEFIELSHVLDRKTYKSIMRENFDERLWEGLPGLMKPNKSKFSKEGLLLNADFGDKYPKADVFQILMETD